MLTDFLIERGFQFFAGGWTQFAAAFAVSFTIMIVFGRGFIRLMRKIQGKGQPISENVPIEHQKKAGTPSMGGIAIVLGVIVSTLIVTACVGQLTVNVLVALFVMVCYAAIGFADDYIKTFKKRKDGLNGWIKIIGQITLGLIVGLTLRYSPVTTMNEVVNTRVENGITIVQKSPDVKSTQTTIPFFKNHNCNYADLFSFLGEANKYRAGWIFFVLLTIFVVAAVSNGANLNDGMDGMCAGNSAIIGAALIVLAYISGSTVWADYFDVMYIPGSEELVVFLASFVGALIGFLWWNGYPAQVFMGDTGSLTIGGIIGVSAIIIHKELLIPILCGVFLMESVSVILQTQVYKIMKTHGQHVRVFKRAPFHDHFRTSIDQVLKNDPSCKIIFKGNGKLRHEAKIVLRFCITTLLLAAFTILTLKIR